jgi:hypothetical protein
LGYSNRPDRKSLELCGSYRVPSRSSLLPLRTLSPGENRSQANNLFFQPQSPLSPGESVVQLANNTQSSTVATTTGQQAFPNWFNNHRMVSALGQGVARSVRHKEHRLSESTLGSWFNRHRGLSNRFNNETPIRSLLISSICQHRIDSRSGFRGCVTNNPRRGQHRLRTVQNRGVLASQNNTAFSPFQKMHEGFSCRGQTVHLQDSQGRMEEEPPNTARLSLLLHAPGLTLVTHATACVPSACVPPTIWKSHVLPKGLRLKHIMHISFGIILKYYSQGLSP